MRYDALARPAAKPAYSALIKTLYWLLIVLILSGCSRERDTPATTPDAPPPPVTTPTAPSITQPPASLTRAEGSSAEFTVLAAGTAPLSYQWQRNGVDISGATTAQFTLTNVTQADHGAEFRVVISNSAGSVTSASATLSVTTPAPALIAPVITQQPQSLSRVAGSAAQFNVVADGSAPFTYQWLRNGVNLNGQTAAQLTLPSVTLADDGAQFSVVVSNGAGQVTSATAILSVTAATPSNQAPVAVTGGDRSAAIGTALSLDGRGSYDPESQPLSYQWRLVSRPTGSTSAVVDPTSAEASLTPDLSGSYVVELVVNDGQLNSLPAQFTVSVGSAGAQAPVIVLDAISAARVDETLLLDASQSYDPNGAMLSFNWQVLRQPDGSSLAENLSEEQRQQAALELSPDRAGLYRIVLRVSNGNSESQQALEFVADVASTSGDLLSGPPNEPAFFHLSQTGPYPVPDSEIDASGWIATRLEMFLPVDVTVAQVNAVLSTHEAGVVTMTPGVPWVTLSVPQMSDPEAAETLVADLIASGAFIAGKPAYTAAPSILPGAAPNNEALSYLDHQYYARMPAAWNLRELAIARGAPVTVVVPDFYAEDTRHLQINSQQFIFDAGKLSLQRCAASTPASECDPDKPNHGFMVSGMIAANYDDFGVTGMHPGPSSLLHIVSLPIAGITMEEALHSIARVLPRYYQNGGQVVLNTSFGFQSGETRRYHRVYNALLWRYLMQQNEHRFMHFSAAGNERNRGGGMDETLSDFDSPFNLAARRQTVEQMSEEGTISAEEQAEIDRMFARVLNVYGSQATRLMSNTLIVGSSDSDGNESEFSDAAPDLRMMGENLTLPCSKAHPQSECDENMVYNVDGTSFAAPQLSALAAYLWNLDQRLTVAQIKALIVDSWHPEKGFVDAYSAVLKLDQPAQGEWFMRRHLLDVASSDGTSTPDQSFDEHDISRFLNQFEAAEMERLSAGNDEQRDDSRYDLNGNGLTGGERRAAFDVSGVHEGLLDPSPSYDFNGVIVRLDEQALTDDDILCYYAYSPLYTGSAVARNTLLEDVCRVPNKRLAYVERETATLVAWDLTQAQAKRWPLPEGMYFAGIGNGAPAWSPGGDYLAFSAGTATSSGDIYLQHTRQETGPTRLTQTDAYQDLYPTWCGGLFVAYWSADWRIHKIGPGSSDAVLTNATSPVPSPLSCARNGFLAFIYGDALRGTDAGVMESNGHIRELTAGMGSFQSVLYPVLSPSGDRLAFVATNTSGASNLWLVDTDGNNTRAVTPFNNVSGVASWAPNGQRLVFEAGTDLFIYDLESDSVRVLRNSSAQELQPRWSSDGRSIAYISNAAGSYDVWLINANGTNPRNLTQTPDVDEVWPAWEP